jgi:glycosyltransferase involved in cell wall biosynthesis
VSILIPAYNAERWIAETLRSAIAQTWEPKEIIVVNDGSTDRTQEIARQFEPQGVRVVTQKNGGAAAARNNAFSLCQGDYIQWLDADDLLAPDKIARQIEVLADLQNRRALLSGGFAHFKYRYHRAKFIPGPLWRDLSPLEWLLCKLNEDAYMQTATWLVSRELAQAAGSWNTTLLGDDDGEYFCRVLLASSGVRFVPSARVYYRQAGAGSLGYVGGSNKKLDAHWNSMQLHIKYIRSLEDSEQVRSACVTYLQNYFIYFYPQRDDIVTQMKQLTSQLGKQLYQPRLSWKYSWAQRLFGWRVAKRLQLILPRVRELIVRSCDKMLFRLECALSQKRIAIPVDIDPNRSGIADENLRHDKLSSNG